MTELAGSIRGWAGPRPAVGASEDTVSLADAHYRADVDGLRAIAVVPVVLFHAGFQFMSGGFVGVDVFFVISGYLITGILAREIVQGRYSILEFYRRRARRIFPALSAMTLATLIAGYFFLTPADYHDVATSAAALSVFSSNIYFWKSFSYFNFAHAFRPLLHSWSLAVEEQYYLFFPLLLRILNLRRDRLVAALWVICFGSLALAVIAVPSRPSAAFYLLPTRAWELMLGGLLAVGQLPGPRSRLAASVGSVVGLCLIFIPMCAYTAATPFPGLAAVPPTVGTALVIWAGGQGAASAVLSQKPIVSIGQASYSIYLWHLPILAFAAYLVDGPLSTGVALLLCVVSVAIGFVSLRFVERPFRAPAKTWSRNQQAIYASCGMLAVGALSIFLIATDGLPSRMPAASRSFVAVEGDKYRHHAECLTVDKNVVHPEQACRLGAAGAAPTALLWGDSHAMVTATALEQAARRHHSSFLFAADADCPPGLGFTIDAHHDASLTRQLSYQYCSSYNQEMLALALKMPSLRAIIISARWTNWRIGEPPNPVEGQADVRLQDSEGVATSTAANRAKWLRGFTALVNTLTKAGKNVVIVGPVPEPSFDVPQRLYVQRFGLADPARSIPISEYYRRHATILRIFQDMPKDPRVTFIWPVKALCSGGTCPVVDRGRPMFFDQDHLSVYGASKTSSLYDPIFDVRR